jgi:hypothetical protein
LRAIGSLRTMRVAREIRALRHAKDYAGYD